MFIGVATLRINFNGLDCAYTFGIISPKRRRRNVRTIVCKMNPHTGASEKSMLLLIVKLANTTSPTLTILFPIRMVAKSCSELLSRRNNLRSLGDELSLMEKISEGDSEKKATSEDDINPEKNKRTTMEAIRR